MLAQISQGHSDAADILFLAAFIMFVIAAILAGTGGASRWVNSTVLMCAGLACVALAWFII